MNQLNLRECDPFHFGARLSEGEWCIGATRFAVPDGDAILAQSDPVAICDNVIDIMSVFFNVSGRHIRSPRRMSLCVTRVRQIGMYIAHVTLGLRMVAIGEGFCRDPSTVVHACRTIEDMRDDEDFDLIVARAEKLVLISFGLRHRKAARYGKL